MSSMMNARAVFITFPPEIDLNPSPTGNHDMLIGGATQFYNDLIIRLKLNLSLVMATSLGRCTYDARTENASCNGIAGKLASGDADFALIPITLSVYDPRIRDIPARFGPQMIESQWFFASVPYGQAHQKQITVMETLHQIPLYYCLSMMFYFIAHLLINYSVSKGNLFTGRIKWIQMYGVMLLRPTGRVKKSYRRLIYWLCLVLSIMTFQLLMGSTSSDMVTVIPAKYYETYQEIAASNETPVLMAGLSLEEDFRGSTHDPDKQKIYRRSMARGTRLSAGQVDVMTTMSSMISSTVQFFDNEIASMCVLGISCHQNDFIPPHGLKNSAAFDHYISITVYSPFIQPNLRKHVSSIFQRVVEAGIYGRYTSDIRVALSTLGNLDRMTMCLVRLEMSHRLAASTTVRPHNISHFDNLLILTSIMIMISLIAVVVEQRIPKERNERSEILWEKTEANVGT